LTDSSKETVLNWNIIYIVIKWKDINDDHVISQIILTLWNEDADNFVGESRSIIKIERGKINKYSNNKYIGLLPTSVIIYG